ncbi:HK97 family phage prohead protease [Nonomuraea angiospora]|uniref:HK97 family phage prohead protease n=1 Tax=Nonomuraea angiospora TaxID=46172 RepID=UPI0029B394D8|nr:HK97 family phage prohead protease [Nonomuraea angiospora]MDX3101743.1 HK97 family phage prohead protease [Nonomuraea angiospora]
MDTKTLRVEIKDESQGLVKAVFSTFNAIDSDRDVTRPGAFTDGVEVPISAYGHTSWSGVLPVGKATIRQTAKQAILEGRFFMDTQAGKDTFLTVKELGELGQWSYGYDPVEYSYGEFDGQHVRFLDAVKVHEVSPVLVGAGVGTRTLAAKSAVPGTGGKAGRPVAPHECETTSRSWDGAKTLAALGDDLRPSELRTVFAWQDAGADPELKSSYQLAHHHGVGGPANVRACLMGIARLNDGKAAIPDADRKAVYDHLAAHLRDADIEPPELKEAPGGSLKYAEEGHAVMAAVSAFVDRTAEVVALRAAKGRGMAPRSAELLEWLDADLKRLQALLSMPTGPEDPSDSDIASLFARSVAQLQNL